MRLARDIYDNKLDDILNNEDTYFDDHEHHVQSAVSESSEILYGHKIQIRRSLKEK